MKEELRNLLDWLGERYIMVEHGLTDTKKEEELDKALTSIINLVDKELKEIDPDFSDNLENISDWEYYTKYNVNSGDFVRGYNEAIREQRAKLKGVSNE